ncbi:substrate-binding family protein [Streptomyces sp. BK340]|nr:substrate-binding family protein [Streptomyces sp. BK340]
MLAEAGFEVDERLIVSGDYSRAGGEAGAERLPAQATDLDAVFVASDLMAQGVPAVLQRAGKRVPQDIAVGGTTPPRRPPSLRH